MLWPVAANLLCNPCFVFPYVCIFNRWNGMKHVPCSSVSTALCVFQCLRYARVMVVVFLNVGSLIDQQDEQGNGTGFFFFCINPLLCVCVLLLLMFRIVLHYTDKNVFKWDISGPWNLHHQGCFSFLGSVYRVWVFLFNSKIFWDLSYYNESGDRANCEFKELEDKGDVDVNSKVCPSPPHMGRMQLSYCYLRYSNLTEIKVPLC